jgi:hypothetical protein
MLDERNFKGLALNLMFTTLCFSSSRTMDDDPKSTASISQDASKPSNRLRIKPMSLMTGTITSNLAKQNIREVSCVGVPFLKAPGSRARHDFL